MRTLLLLLGLAAAGCGLDNQYTGLGEGALPGEPLGQGGVVACPDCNCNCDGNGGGGSGGEGELTPSDLPDLAGRAYRFDTLALTAPLPAAQAALLNNYFTDQIEAGTFNVLLVIDEDAREDGQTLTARLGAGEATAEGLRFTGEPSLLKAALSGRRFLTTEPTSLDFPNELITPPNLPIQALTLTGTFDAQGERLTDGELDGALSREDAEGLQILASTFAGFLDALHIEPDLDLDGDGTNDAWRVSGTLSAAPATLLE